MENGGICSRPRRWLPLGSTAAGHITTAGWQGFVPVNRQQGRAKRG
ncbi:MAG: hypothetical protein GY803_11555 [Chloroflexi bacterium]|nr:hypothetical protein [Chloroflexota bacterium]